MEKQRRLARKAMGEEVSKKMKKQQKQQSQQQRHQRARRQHHRAAPAPTSAAAAAGTGLSTGDAVNLALTGVVAQQLLGHQQGQDQQLEQLALQTQGVLTLHGAAEEELQVAAGESERAEGGADEAGIDIGNAESGDGQQQELQEQQEPFSQADADTSATALQSSHSSQEEGEEEGEGEKDEDEGEDEDVEDVENEEEDEEEWDGSQGSEDGYGDDDDHEEEADFYSEEATSPAELQLEGEEMEEDADGTGQDEEGAEGDYLEDEEGDEDEDADGGGEEEEEALLAGCIMKTLQLLVWLLMLPIRPCLHMRCCSCCARKSTAETEHAEGGPSSGSSSAELAQASSAAAAKVPSSSGQRKPKQSLPVLLLRGALLFAVYGIALGYLAFCLWYVLLFGLYQSIQAVQSFLTIWVTTVVWNLAIMQPITILSTTIISLVIVPPIKGALSWLPMLTPASVQVTVSATSSHPADISPLTSFLEYLCFIWAPGVASGMSQDAALVTFASPPLLLHCFQDFLAKVQQQQQQLQRGGAAPTAAAGSRVPCFPAGLHVSSSTVKAQALRILAQQQPVVELCAVRRRELVSLLYMQRKASQRAAELQEKKV